MSDNTATTPPETTADLETLLKWTRRGPGWNSRTYPVQYKTLEGGCTLIAIVPTLWTGRTQGVWRNDGRVVPFERARAKQLADPPAFTSHIPWQRSQQIERHVPAGG